MPQDYLEIRGARVHNLKNISLRLPHNEFIVVTGVSGSGKSSLVFDIIYAEGQRRYVESLSSYARQFLERMERPDADEVLGISPTVAIRQRNTTKNPRSTVATTTDIADFLRLLFARVGHTLCPQCGRRVTKDGVDLVTREILAQEPGSRWYVLFPIETEGAVTVDGDSGPESAELLSGRLAQLRERGYNRLFQGGRIFEFSTPESLLDIDFDQPVYSLLDRLIVGPGLGERVGDAVETAYRECGEIRFERADRPSQHLRFSNAFECRHCGVDHPQLLPQAFNLNSTEGHCPTCTGTGTAYDFVLERVLNAPERSLRDGPVAPKKGILAPCLRRLVKAAAAANIPLDCPYQDLTPEQRAYLEYGSPDFVGLVGLLAELRLKRKQPPLVSAMLAGWQGMVRCRACAGRRFRPAVLNVQVGGKAIDQVLSLSLEEALSFFRSLDLQASEARIAERLVTEIENRLVFLTDVGLGYLALDRQSNTLSGGEAQRIQLASSLGARLVGVSYVLDEPSIGLHSRDTARLIKVLRQLRDLGNTIFVVEHDREVMRSADRLVDLGPAGGEHGGKLTFIGTYDELVADSNGSVTGRYLSGRTRIAVPQQRRQFRDHHVLQFLGASEHNLKEIDFEVPLGLMTAVTGVSGSGKSTLMHNIVHQHLKREPHHVPDQPGPAKLREVVGSALVEQVVLVDQSTNQLSDRSVPATYLGVFDEIRHLFARTALAVKIGYTASHFSFNVDGSYTYSRSLIGRCPTCQGSGRQTIDMQFLADVKLTCEDCQGRRYHADILEVEYDGRSIWDVLQMTVEEALQRFSDRPFIARRLQVLSDVGLGYIRLGQPAAELSGGEAQRLKLAYHLADQRCKGALYLFDEPTTGLHFDDIRKLLAAFASLIDKGASVMVVEHNLDVIKCADWVIDLGPEGGHAGGAIVACGPPETIARCERSHTGRFLRQELA